MAGPSVSRACVLSLVVVLPLVLYCGFAKQTTPITKRLFTPNHQVSWGVTWGECSRSCGLGEEKARAVCVSDPANYKLGDAACHGVSKPTVPESRTCHGDCTDPGEESLAKRAEGNVTAAVFAPSHCDRSLRAETGEVTSPDWPMKSVRFLHCRLTLILPQDKRPLLTFDTFSLQGGTACAPSNYVEIVDMMTNRSEVICGSRRAFTWTADSNRVQIKFSAESSSVFNRFHATYIAIANAPTSDCSTVFQDPIGRYVSTIASSGNQQPATCQVLFHAEPDSRVVLSFAIFTVLCANPVQIRDVQSDEEDTLCGSHQPFSWTSTGNEATLEYGRPTDASWEIDLEYETLEALPIEAVDVDCSQTFSVSAEGVLTSPGYPGSYPDSLYCTTLLRADPGQVITVAFLDFMVEPSTKQNGEPMATCQFDRVTILDVTTDRTDVVCGMRQPFAWTSDSNEVMIVFQSDNSEAYAGYQAKYWAADRHPEPDCLTVVVNDDGPDNITTAQHPGPYPSNSECYLTVHQDPDTSMTFDFLTFDLEESDSCEKDYLQLTDLVSGRTDRFCGRLPAFTWTSDGNEVQLAFRSDRMIEGGGVRLLRRAVGLPPKNFPERDCRQLLTKRRDYVRLPVSLSNPPLGNAHCFILISVEPVQRIILSIDTFAIEPPPTGYDPDFVEIRDVFAQGGGYTEKLEGKLPPFTWTSRRNELTITATQQSSEIAAVRLQGTYHATRRPQQACSRILLEDTGVIHWPEDFATDSTDCELTIHSHPLKYVILTFDRLDLPGNNCQDFSVQVIDVDPSRTLTYCETQEPFSLISTSNEIRLHFKWTRSGLLPVTRRQVSQDAVATVKHFAVDRPLQAVEHVAEYHRIFRKEQGEFSSLDRSRALWMSGNCSVLIEVPAGKQVLIHFQDFLIGEQRPGSSTASPVPCQPEFVLVEDITNGRKNVYCGHHPYFSWLSDSNVVKVTFFTNPVIVYHGFRAKYETVDRVRGPSQHSSDETGRHESANFPSSYPSDHEQSWVVHAPPEHIVSLVVNSFSLEDSAGCSKDYVEFEDLSSRYSSVLCGDHGLFAWTSGGNEVAVTMATDDDVTSSGISMVHTWVDVSQGCFRLLRGESGSLKSSDFLDADAIWTGSCKLIIHTAPDKRLSLLVEGLHIKKNCGNAGVTIVDIATLRSKVICEVAHDFGFTSDTNEVAFGYINYQTTLPDFKVSWLSLHRDGQHECSNVFDDPPATISLDDYRALLLLLPADSTCHYLLTLPPGESVLLVFSDFSLPDAVCERHYVEVEDLDTLRYDRYCVARPPFAWKSDGNEVMIRFAKTENVSSMHVVANFTSIPKPQSAECSKVLTGDTGDLQSVNYPSHYPTDTGCQTLIHTDTGNRVQIVFSVFELEAETREVGCTSDYLKLTDLATGHTTTLCGLLRPFIWSSLANEVLLEFTSDGSNPFPGYSAYYTVLPRILEVPGCNEIFTSDTGVVQSPNEASSSSPYSNALDCYQLIRVAAWQHVILSFSILSLESDPNCRKDFVQLTDTITGDIDIYCGELEPFTWISDGNEVVVKFHTDTENRYQGYRATFKALVNEPFSSCDVSLTTASGTIQSPGFPLQYANNLHCVTTVTVEEHYLIQLVFAIFNLEDSDACAYDYMELRTQGIGAAHTYCGIKAPFSWLSQGNVAIVTFHTDHIVTLSGFKADYEVIAKPSRLKACDESLFTPNGTLSSPHYPEAYPSNEDCRTAITVDPGYVIQIYFSEFELEYHQTCKYDYILLSNFPEGPQDKYCGMLDPFNWVSKTNQVMLEFHSDASTRMRGYTAHYVTYPAPLLPSPTENLPAKVSKCNTEMSAGQGVISSPNFPYKYGNDLNCRTEIETAVGTRINVTFHFMDIEEHRGCQWDRVEILDLVSGRKSEPFCGSLFSGHRSWQSDSNHIVVIFVSDDIVTRIGFYATYSVAPTTNQV